MSLGLMKFKKLREPETPPLSIGTPSTTINGSFEALKDEPPRILIAAPAPGEPSPGVIETPAIFPANNS